MPKKRSVGIHYAVAYTLKRRGRGTRGIDGFVVPPLEGFWGQEGRGRGEPSRDSPPDSKARRPPPDEAGADAAP